MQTLRILAATASGLIVTKIYDWLRLFEPTSFYVQLVEKTLKDLKYFMILLVVASLMFGLPMNLVNMSLQDDSPLVKQFSNIGILDTVITQYVLSLGEFLDFFDGVPVGHLETAFAILLFFGATFFTYLTMLNMLIAIMGDSFDYCTEMKDRLSKQNRLNILCDYSAVFPKKDKHEQTDVFMIIV